MPFARFWSKSDELRQGRFVRRWGGSLGLNWPREKGVGGKGGRLEGGGGCSMEVGVTGGFGLE